VAKVRDQGIKREGVVNMLMDHMSVNIGGKFKQNG
jgi:hypothetical protein